MFLVVRPCPLYTSAVVEIYPAVHTRPAEHTHKHSWVHFLRLMLTDCSVSGCTCFFCKAVCVALARHLLSYICIQLPTALNSFFAVPQGAGEGVRAMVLRLPLVYLEGPWTNLFGVTMFKALEQIAKEAGFVPYLASGESLQTPMLAALHACIGCHLKEPSGDVCRGQRFHWCPRVTSYEGLGGSTVKNIFHVHLAGLKPLNHPWGIA